LVSSTHADDAQIFTDSVLGISFSIPNGWKVVTDGSRIDTRNVIIEHFPNGGQSQVGGVLAGKYIRIEISLVGFSKPSDALLDRWIEPLTDKEGLYAQTSQKIGGYDTVKRQVLLFGDNVQLGTILYVSSIDKTLLINAYGGDPGLYRPILDNLVESLKFGDVIDKAILPRINQLGKVDESTIKVQAIITTTSSNSYSMPLGARHTFDIFPLPAPGSQDCKVIGCYWISQGPNGTYTHNKTSTAGAIDFLADVGTRVYASRAGTVIKVGKPAGFSGFGNIVLIQHDDGTTTLYAHLSDWRANLLNTRVAKGAWIGLSGITGWDDFGLSKPWAPHLHFQARNGPSIFDPPVAVDNIEGIFWNDTAHSTGYAYGPPVLYSDSGFTGVSQAFPESVTNLLDQEMQGGVGNDRASSSDWQYPWTFQLFAHANAGVPSFRAHGDITDFANYRFGDGTSLNDNVSSVTVALNSCPVPGVGTPPSISTRNDSSENQTLMVTDCQGIPAPPPIDPVVLLSPADGQSISSQPIQFSWSIAPVSNLDGYELLVKTVANMDSGGSVLLDVFPGNTTYSYTFAPISGPVYWSVRPKVSGVYGPWATANGHIASFGFGISIPTPTSQPGPPPSGWSETFYRDNNLQSSCGSRNETDVYMFRDSDGGWGPPSGCPSYDSAWSVRMERSDAYFQGGRYDFGLFYDDGARLYVDDILRVDGWIGTQHYEGVDISGGYHRLRLDYKNNAGHAIVQLWWQGPGALPGNNQSQDPQQWWANYWGNRNQWQDSVGRENEGTGFLDHDWGGGGPGFGLPADQFSTRFERTVYFYCGTYQFHLESDDGSRLWIDGALVPGFDNWISNVWDITQNVQLVTGNHLLKIDHFENGGAAHIRLNWTTVSQCPPSNPVPQMSSVSPNAVTAGSGTPFLSVTGSNFIPSSMLYWNSQPVDSQYVDGTHLTAVIPSSYIANQGTAILNVTNPPPVGGSSNNITLTILPQPPKPSAEFDAWPQTGTASLTVAMHIVELSGITSCSWNYGDEQTSTNCAQSHDHVYSAAGSYTVSLNVSGPGGNDSLTRMNYITVTSGGDSYEPDGTSGQAKQITSGSPQAHSIIPAVDIDWVKFTLSQSSAIHLETSGTSSSDTRMWLYDSNLNELELDDDDGAGNYSLIDRTCNTNPLAPGTYYVKIDEFQNDNEIPSYSLAYSITQECSPAQGVVADFSATPTGGTAPLGVAFHNLSSGSYTSCSWSFGDSQTSTSCNEFVNHTYSSSGAYSVALSISGPSGDNSIQKTELIHVTQDSNIYLPLLRNGQGVETVTVYGSPEDVEMGNINCPNWDTCRNSPYANFFPPSNPVGTVGVDLDSLGNYNVKRIILFFDTSFIPSSATIVDVELHVYTGAYVNGSGMVYVAKTTTSVPVTSLDFSRIDYAETAAGSYWPNANAWTSIQFRPGALGWIAKGGLTQIGLLQDRDLMNNPPSDRVDAVVALSEDPVSRPYLVVKYLP
jgi:PKD repeat protein/murein DD-endopeptidase MepM/ murein hydrolase activator NlpD